MSRNYQIGILGCGTVGSGVVKVLRNLARTDITIAKIYVRSEARAQELSSQLGLDKKVFTWNLDDVIANPEIDLVVELMGGVKDTKAIILKALANGKDVVTANKDLLALEGAELFEAAKKHQRTIMYEAAVAGGIPIISTLKQSLRANKILSLYGIINGTTNYILDTMKKEGSAFADVLKRAQELGFAESDPTNDVDGHDAAYKTAILASIISGKRVDVNKVYREGIRKITQTDFRSAEKRGYEIKLLGIINNTDTKLDARVHPVFVKKDNPLASVAQENNAILVKGDAVGMLTLIGKGAGSLPTASSVVGDILMLAAQAQNTVNPNPQYVCTHSAYAEMKDIGEVSNAFYVRVSMHDKIGVLKDLGEILAKHSANVKFIDQYDVQGTEAHADFIIDPLPEKEMSQIVKEIAALDSIKGVESVIRVL